MRQRWIVISNCQTTGLANSIECLAPDVDVTACDIWQFERRAAEAPDWLMAYDRAILLPEAKRRAAALGAALPAHSLVPDFYFPGFHPDCVHVFADGSMVNDGPVHAYHSLIALAAYKEGLDAARAAAFFTAKTYRAAGFFEMWDAHRDRMIAAFAEQGLTIAPIFLKRGQTIPFMHAIDHPRIDVLFDIAAILLAANDRPVHRGVLPPPDNLADTSWPVYPEIGARLGLPGSYLFKPANENRPLALEGFLARSLACFARWDRSRLRVQPHMQPALQAIRGLMRAAS